MREADQFEFSFDEVAPDAEDGVAAWQRERAERIEALARKLALPIGRWVRVRLRPDAREVVGVLRFATPDLNPATSRDAHLLLAVGKATFEYADVEACSVVPKE